MQICAMLGTPLSCVILTREQTVAIHVSVAIISLIIMTTTMTFWGREYEIFRPQLTEYYRQRGRPCQYTLVQSSRVTLKMCMYKDSRYTIWVLRLHITNNIRE